MKTEGEATASESLGTADGRNQPRAEKHLNSEDGFFMTQVRNFSLLNYKLFAVSRTLAAI